MAWISRLKDRSYMIDFDSGCIYDESHTVVKQITSPIQLNILLYFAEHPEEWVKKDSIIARCWPDNPGADTVAEGTFYRQMHNVYHLHGKVEESIESAHGMGYKYHGTEKEDFHAPRRPAPQDTPANENGNAVKVAALRIHLLDPRHPDIDAKLKQAIYLIIDILEQGVAADFESVSDRAWESRSLRDKAEQIFEAYEKLLENTRSMELSDSNIKL